jgi:hypothetical protein
MEHGIEERRGEGHASEENELLQAKTRKEDMVEPLSIRFRDSFAPFWTGPETKSLRRDVP